MKPASMGGPYRVPPEPNRWPAIALAVAVHALLLAFLWFGVNWQNNEPTAVEAEVWDMKTQEAAPPPPPPPPPEEVQPQPEPEPPKAVEQPVEKPVTPPDINLEREKKRKEQLKKQQEEQREAEKAREEAEAKKAELKKQAEAKKEAEQQQKLEEQKQKELEKKEAEKKAKAEKLAKAKAKAAEKARLDRIRAETLQGIVGAAGKAGTAARSTAPHSDSGYVASIRTKVKSTTSYAGSTDLPGNPEVVFRVDQLPTGEIISVRKTKSSGVPAFDDAVEKGIIKASPLPKKKDGTVERSLEIGFKMKDMN